MFFFTQTQNVFLFEFLSFCINLEKMAWGGLPGGTLFRMQHKPYYDFNQHQFTKVFYFQWLFLLGSWKGTRTSFPALTVLKIDTRCLNHPTDLTTNRVESQISQLNSSGWKFSRLSGLFQFFDIEKMNEVWRDLKEGSFKWIYNVNENTIECIL